MSTPLILPGRRRTSLWREVLRFVVLHVKIFRLTRQHH